MVEGYNLLVLRRLTEKEAFRLRERGLIVGTSGFSYKHWKGRFYPYGISPSLYLEHYMLFFPAVELNVSFYRLPNESAILSWKKRARPYFTYVMKLSRIVTHRKRLMVDRQELFRHLDRYKLLGEKLEGVLVQLPSSLKKDVSLLERFLNLLPSDVSFFFEFRNPQWWDEEVFALLRNYSAGIVITDWKGMPEDYPPGFSSYYIRRHGPTSRYTSRYTEDYLDELARRMIALPGRVYAFFNNDYMGFAVENAHYLQRRLLSML